eukprot:7403184-Prorocentrum_lima.AAC.1
MQTVDPGSLLAACHYAQKATSQPRLRAPLGATSQAGGGLEKPLHLPPPQIPANAAFPQHGQLSTL